MQLIFILHILLLQWLSSVKGQKNWNYEILEIRSYTTNPDWINCDFTVERISRGVFGFSGFIYIMEDLYDNNKVSGYIERSQFKSGPFTKLPMSIDDMPLSEAMNKFYKDIAMPELQNCATNAPYFEDTFEEPVTKRDIDLNKCNFATDHMPGVMMEGYYKVTMQIQREELKANYVTLVLVEEDKS